MGIILNGGAATPQKIYLNGSVIPQKVYLNGTVIWINEKRIYPGTGIANAQNLGSYKPYWSYSDSGSVVHVESYGGTDAGYGFIAIPFSSVGFSQCYFHNLAVNTTVDNAVKAEIGIGDINCNFTQMFLDVNSSGTWGSGSVFNINSPNNAYYLLIRTWASANFSGHKITVDLTGFTLK